MLRFILALTIAGALGASAARAQTPDNEDTRYQFNRVEDGYLRLDLKTGQVSLCSRRNIGWACVTVPDDRAAFDGEIARLQGENAALKKAMLDRGLPLPRGITPDAPVARGDRDMNRDLKLPSNADIDRMMTAVEKVWRRLVDMLMGLQKDLMKKT
jgi:hypothetical protein